MFERPEAFLLLFLFLLLFSFSRWRKRKASLGFPNLASLNSKIPKPSWLKKNFVPLTGGLAIFFFVLALVNPLHNVERSREVKETRLIVMVEDLSGSMYSETDGISKVNLSLNAAKKFVDLRLSEEINSDYISLIAFASYSKLITPFTNDPNVILRGINLLRRDDCEVGSGTEASEAIWLSINLFLNYLPKDERPTVGELMSMRNSLYGGDGGDVWLPESLREKDFGKGKILVFMSDGEFYLPSPSQGSVKANYYGYGYSSSYTPNLVRAVRLMRLLGIKCYFLLTEPNLDDRIKNELFSISKHRNVNSVGHIFELEENLGNINKIYRQIDELEKTELILQGFSQKKGGGNLFFHIGLMFFLLHIFFRYIKNFRKIET